MRDRAEEEKSDRERERAEEEKSDSERQSGGGEEQ